VSLSLPQSVKITQPALPDNIRLPAELSEASDILEISEAIPLLALATRTRAATLEVSPVRSRGADAKSIHARKLLYGDLGKPNPVCPEASRDEGGT